MNIEIGSPDWLIQKLESYKNGISQALLRYLNTAFGNIVLPLFSVLTGASIFANRDTISSYFLATAPLESFYFIPTIAAVLIFPITLLGFFQFDRRKLRISLFGFCWLLFVLGKNKSNTSSFLGSAFIFFSIPLVGYLLSLRLSSKMRVASLLISCLLAIYLASIWHGLFSKDEFYSGNFFYTAGHGFLTLSILLGELEAGILCFRPLSLDFFSYYLSPLNFFFLPIASTHLAAKARDLELFLSGASNIILAVLLLMIERQLIQLTKSPFNIFQLYFSFYVHAWSGLRIPIGIGQLIGFSLPSSIFSYPLLATSPQDYWRRWNTYYYEWFRSFVLFPVFKSTESLFLGVFATFACTFFFHQGEWLLISSFEQIRPLQHLEYLSLLFYMLMGFVIYISIKFAPLWPAGNRVSGWAGVLVTNIVMQLLFLVWYIRF